MSEEHWVTWTEYWRTTHWPSRGRTDRLVLYPRYFKNEKIFEEQWCERCGTVRYWKGALAASHVHRQGVTNQTPGHEECVPFQFERYTSNPDYPYDPPTSR